MDSTYRTFRFPRCNEKKRYSNPGIQLTFARLMTLAYMLKLTQCTVNSTVLSEADVENSKLIVNGQAIRITAERNPADLKWDAVGAEYVVESTGLFLSKDKAQAHIEAGKNIL